MGTKMPTTQTIKSSNLALAREAVRSSDFIGADELHTACDILELEGDWQDRDTARFLRKSLPRRQKASDTAKPKRKAIDPWQWVGWGAVALVLIFAACAFADTPAKTRADLAIYDMHTTPYCTQSVCITSVERLATK